MSCHKVQLFGSFRERIGKGCVSLKLPNGATAGDVLAVVCGSEGEAVRWRRCMRVAVNCNYVSYDTTLAEGDEVALIPPVAGG